MKKLKPVLFVLLLAVYISTLFLDDYNIIVQYFRHISIFILLSWIVFFLTNRIAENAVLRYHLKGSKELIVHLFRVLIFGLIIAGTAYVQFQYINYAIGLNLEHCNYYDDYNNLIYSNLYQTGTCPIINVTEKTENSLSINVTEELEYHVDLALTLDGIDYFDSDTYNTRKVSIEILYQGDILIYSHTTKEITNIVESNDGNVGSYKKAVSIADYTNWETEGYIFKHAEHTDYIYGNKEEIRVYNFADVEFEEEDYNINRFYTEFDEGNMLMYDDGESAPVKIFDYDISYNSDANSVEYFVSTDVTKWANNQEDYEGIGIFVEADSKSITYIKKENEYRWHNELYFDDLDGDGFEIFKQTDITMTTNGETTYSIRKLFIPFSRNGETIYYDNVTKTELGIDYIYHTYKKYETSEFGSIVTYYVDNDLEYMNGFWQYLYEGPNQSLTDTFNDDYRSLYSSQFSSFSFYGLVPDYMYDDFYNIPVYFQLEG